MFFAPDACTWRQSTHPEIFFESMFFVPVSFYDWWFLFEASRVCWCDRELMPKRLNWSHRHQHNLLLSYLTNVYWFALELFLLKLEKNFWNFFEVTLSYNLPNWGKECWPFQLHVALVLLSRIHHHSAWIASSNGELYCLAISYHASSSTERTSGSWSSQA